MINFSLTKAYQILETRYIFDNNNKQICYYFSINSRYNEFSYFKYGEDEINYKDSNIVDISYN